MFETNSLFSTDKFDLTVEERGEKEGKKWCVCKRITILTPVKTVKKGKEKEEVSCSEEECEKYSPIIKVQILSRHKTELEATEEWEKTLKNKRNQ